MSRTDTHTTPSRDRETTFKAFRQSLVVLIAFLLSLALLPIGLVAMGQSWRALHITNENLEASIHARTSSLVTPERRALDSQMGVANALADTIGVLDLSTDQCTEVMQRVLETNPRLTFAGLVEEGSVSQCNNIGQVLEFEPDPRVDALFVDPQPYITFRERGSTSQEPVILVAYPSFAEEGGLKGYVTISLSAEPLLQSDTTDAQNTDVALVTFNKFGDILSSHTPEGPITDYLPAGLALHGVDRVRRYAPDLGRSDPSGRSLRPWQLGARRVAAPDRAVVCRVHAPLPVPHVAGRDHRCGDVVEPAGAASCSRSRPTDAGFRDPAQRGDVREYRGRPERDPDHQRDLRSDGGPTSARRGRSRKRRLRTRGAAQGGASPGEEQPAAHFLHHQHAGAPGRQPRGGRGPSQVPGPGDKSRLGAPRALPGAVADPYPVRRLAQ